MAAGDRPRLAVRSLPLLPRSPPPTPLLRATLSSVPLVNNSNNNAVASLDLSMASSSRKRAAAASAKDTDGRSKDSMYQTLIRHLQKSSPPPPSTGAAPSTSTSTPSLTSSPCASVPPSPSSSPSPSCSTSTSSSLALSMSSATRLTAAARKEKLKHVSCFMCPVCRKRFQRHIAMNAHFQSEHIGNGPNDTKICRLCSSHSARDMVGIREHIMAEHGLNLDDAAAFFVQPEGLKGIGNPASRATIVVVNEEEVVVKREEPEEMAPEEEVARDLSIRKSSDVTLVEINSNNNCSGGMDSLAGKIKRPRQDVLRLNSLPSSGNPGKWRCQHCCIVFPNQTLYFLHRGFHSDADPWRCNGCGRACDDMYDFNTHLVSVSHN